MANSKKKTSKKSVAVEAAPKRPRGRPPKVAVAPVTEVSEAKVSKFSGLFKSKAKIFVVLSLVLLATLPSVYFYNKYQDSQKSNQSQEEIEKEEAQKLVKQVGEHALLPTDEEPTVATVSDVTKLQGQAFFLDAQNGDKVLVYSNARKVVLYRPSVQRIVNMTPLNLEPTGEEAPASTPAQ